MVLFSYEKGPKNTGAWPVEVAAQRSSITLMLTRLGQSNAQNPHISDHVDVSCSFDFEYNVEAAILEVKTFFDGLCLGKCHLGQILCLYLTYCPDCTHLSKSADFDADYWIHDQPGV